MVRPEPAVGSRAPASDAATSARPRRRSFVRRRPWSSLGIALLALVLIAAFALAFLVEEPLRRSMEARINAALQGYQVEIGGLDLHPLGLAIDLEGVVIVQEAHPTPPVANFPRLGASVQWSALIYGDLVADFVLDSPELHVNLTQTRAEAADERDLDERGWQEAAKEIYPLEVNEFRVNDGRITYEDGSELTPIEITDADLVAENIRNVSSREGTYPSPVRLDASIFGSGDLAFDGAADFLATPHVGLRGDLELESIPLRPLTPMAKHYAIQVAQGTLSAKGDLEYAPWARKVALDDLSIDGMKADFVREGRTGAQGEKVTDDAVRAATDPETAPETVVSIEHLRMKGSELGYANRDTDPKYRLFVSELDVSVRDFSNQKGGPPGKAEMKGLFMGSGETRATASFQPRSDRTEFSASFEIRDADLRAMNALFQAYGGFDVNAGTFSLFTEVAVREGAVDGYVKPLFAGLDVYDRRQDADENVFQQAYEGIVGGIGTLLENTPRDEVATRTDLSGRIENPETSTWEIILGLIQNAFFQAILPGLEEQAQS